jgi:hypothetical protein
MSSSFCIMGFWWSLAKVRSRDMGYLGTDVQCSADSYQVRHKVAGQLAA